MVNKYSISPKFQAERKRVDKTPFQTKAMREVQHLRNKQVLQILK